MEKLTELWLDEYWVDNKKAMDSPERLGRDSLEGMELGEGQPRIRE